jgi:hypothetical protein
VLLHGAVDAEHEDIVAHHLRVVGHKVTIIDAFVFVLSHALVRLHRQMAAKAARRPRRMADLAVHVLVAVRERPFALIRRHRHLAPFLAVALQRFGITRLRIVIR